MANVNFLIGSAAGYAALETKVDTNFYLTTDTKELYIGSKKITNEADLAAAVATITKLENTEETTGSIRYIVKGYFDAYRASNLIYIDESGTVGQEGYQPEVSVADAIAALESAVGEGGSVATQIAAEIAKLDATVSIVDTLNENPLNIEITEVDGKLTGVTASIDAETFDTYGSAAAVLGINTDAASANTVYGAKAAAAAAQSDVDALETLVGVIPAGATATTVTGYVDEKIAEVEGDATTLEGRVAANENAITLLNKTDGTVGSVKKTVDDAIAAVVADAPASLDTLKEISDWISGHADDASAMNSQIQANTAAIGVASEEESEPGAGDAVVATGLHKKIEDEAARAAAAEGGLDTRLSALEGSGSGSIADQIDAAISNLDGSATIASKTGNVVTIKTGVTEADGVVSNDSGSDIVLEEVASTGAAADVSVLDSGDYFTGTTVEGVLAEVGQRLTWQNF